MKRINKISISILILSYLLFSYSCTKSDEWKPGPLPPTDNPGVYFPGNIPKIIEVEANSKGELKNEYFTIDMARDGLKSTNSLTVPILIRNVESNMVVDETVQFKAGETTAQLKIKVSSFDFNEQYRLSLEVPETYTNPYKDYGTEEPGGSTRIDALVEVVSLLGEATFTPTDFSKEPATTFFPFVQRIYDNMDGTYSIKNFLYNDTGYTMDFKLDEKGNIKVLEECGYHDLKENRWYFYSAPSSSSSNYIPCYIPTEDPKENIRYIYFYTNPDDRYFDFRLDLEKKVGKMTGYAKYEKSSSGRVTFNIVWE